MQEDGAAAPLPPLADVPVEHDADIVQPVLPPHSFMTRPVWQTDQPVVVAVARCIAPPVLHAAGAHAQIRAPFPTPPTIECVKDLHGSSGRAPVSLPLEGTDSRAAKRTPHCNRAETQDALARLAGRGPNRQCR